MAKPSVNGCLPETVAAASEVPANPQDEQQDAASALSPEIAKKLARPGEVERASKEMRYEVREASTDRCVVHVGDARGGGGRHPVRDAARAGFFPPCCVGKPGKLYNALNNMVPTNQRDREREMARLTCLFRQGVG